MRKAKKNKQKLQHMRNFEKKQEQLKKYMEIHRNAHDDLTSKDKVKKPIKKTKTSVYNDIQVVYVTFLSMETKNLVYDRLMP